MDSSSLLAISFDCYGTLIDWESGIVPVLKNILAKHGQLVADASILELYGEFEAEAESGPYRPYRQVLASVVESFAHQFQFEASEEERRSLAESIEGWRPFPDTVKSLRILQDNYKLAIISNIDNDLFAVTCQQLEVEFDAVITAEDAQSYKPSLKNFHMALRALSLPPNRLLHAAQSIYHDVVPVKSLGIRTAWVNRKSAGPGIGAVVASTASLAEREPDLEVPSLGALADALQMRQ